MLAIWLPSRLPGRRGELAATTSRAIEPKLEARAALAARRRRPPPDERARLRAQASGDDVILRLVERLCAAVARRRCSAPASWPPSWPAIRRSWRCRRCSPRTCSRSTAATARFGEHVQVQTGRLFVVVLTLVAVPHRADARRSRSSTSPRSTRSPATRRCRRCSSPRCSGEAAPSGARSRSRCGSRWP